jgi:hypothetical protein
MAIGSTGLATAPSTPDQPNGTDVTMLISNTMSKETAPSQPGESSYPVVVTHARQFLDKIRRTKVLHILKGATTNKLLQKKN